MKWIKIPFYFLYRLYFGVVFFGVLLILYPVFWILLSSDKNFDRAFKLKVWTAKTILFFQLIKVKVIEKPDNIGDGNYVICMNHTSYLDIITLYPVFNDHRFLFIGKKELLTWPILNIFFKRIDIAVDRQNSRKAVMALKRATNELKNGWSIAIFPEGKIPFNNPKLHPFKNGAFKMAIETQTPILPVTYVNNWKLFKTDPVLTANAHPGISKVIIHEPISTKGMTQKDLVSLRQQTFDVINQPILKQIEKHGNHQ